ncbi:hypothetical protein [Sodalis sp. (in: enterobacteria)]|uniref:hypothetical protein n=1 Tax=Sodalis sp. (in: enterobacteria) TaxID=1898979 RepID=UPI003F687839
MGKTFRQTPVRGIKNKKIEKKINRLKRLPSSRKARPRGGEKSLHRAWIKNNHR